MPNRIGCIHQTMMAGNGDRKLYSKSLKRSEIETKSSTRGYYGNHGNEEI